MLIEKKELEIRGNEGAFGYMKRNERNEREVLPTLASISFFPFFSHLLCTRAARLIPNWTIPKRLDAW